MKILLFLLIFVSVVNGGKVLFYIPFASKSMKITFIPILEELSKRGHEIFVAMPFKVETDKYTVISSDPNGDIMTTLDTITQPVLQKTDSSVMNVMSKLKSGALELNDNVLNDPIMKKLLSDPSTTFDVVVVSPFLAGEAGYYLAHRFKAPLAVYSTAQANFPFISSAIGQPYNPSYSTMPILPFTGYLNFFQRAINTFVAFFFEQVFRNTIILNGVNGLLDKYFPGETRPTLLELERNISLAFTFGHPFILDGWSPMVPNSVHLGMMNCIPGQSFEKGDKIGDFLANSKNGVVFVSFGSVIKASLMTEENKKILLNVFKRFPQYDFIWKWDQDSMPGKPDNVLLSKWLPQRDILAHPKLKVFITHAGQSSFQETLCYQKPVVAIPVTGDQPINAREAEHLGIGISHPYLTMDEEQLYQDLDSVLHDPKYTENAIKYGSVLNDQITRPLDRAIWWIEHIMRHPFMYQGKSPVHKLYWFQYFLLDVIAFYLFIIYVVFKIIKFIVCKLCCGSSQKAKND